MFNIGDIPSGSWDGGVITHASLASNGASAAYGIGTNAQRFRAPQDCIIVGVDFEAVGANQTASISNSYRRFTAYNASTDGAGTVAVASLNLSASVASNSTLAYTLGATSVLTMAAGEILAVSQTTVGGNHSNGTVVQAPAHHIKYRPI